MDTALGWLLVVFQILFGLGALGTFVEFLHGRKIGNLFGAMTFAAAAGVSLCLSAWWPLLAGFVFGWVLRLLGLDPDSAMEAPRQYFASTGQQAQRPTVQVHIQGLAGVRHEEWTVGDQVDVATYLQFNDFGDLYAIGVFKEGREEIVVTTKDQWDECKYEASREIGA